MAPEHRRPLMAFAFVVLTAALLLGNGLRTQVVDHLVQGKAPAVLVSALAPDLVLGRTLHSTDAPAPVTATASRPPGRSVTPVEGQAETAPPARGPAARTNVAARTGSDVMTSRTLHPGAGQGVTTNRTGAHRSAKPSRAHGGVKAHRALHKAKHTRIATSHRAKASSAATTKVARSHQKSVKHHAKPHRKHHGRHHRRHHHHHRHHRR